MTRTIAWRPLALPRSLARPATTATAAKSRWLTRRAALGTHRTPATATGASRTITWLIAVKLTPAPAPGLTNREVGGLAFGNLALLARQSGSNQASVDGTVILGRLALVGVGVRVDISICAGVGVGIGTVIHGHGGG
jgi:hypothetical protein